MAAVTIRSDFGAKENKICHCFHFFPFYLPWSDGTGWQNLSCFLFFFFLMLRFKPAFSLTSFTFIKSLFSFSSLSAIRVVSSAYLRVLIHTCLKSGPNVSVLAQLPAGLFRVRVTTVHRQGELSFVCTRKRHQRSKAADLSPEAGGRKLQARCKRVSCMLTYVRAFCFLFY